MASRRSSACLNCGRPLTDEFCAHCGQRNTHYRVSFWRLVGEALAETFEVDGRIPRTILPFLFRPGVLTREYNQGRRMTYSSPVRIFLLATVVFFFTLSLQPIEGGLPDNLHWQQTEDGLLISDDKNPEGEIVIGSDGKSITSSDDTPQILRRPLERLSSKEPAEAVEMLVGSGIEHAPKVVFGLIPLFALVLKLLQVRHRVFYFEHLVFSLHYFSFVMLTSTVGAIVKDDGLIVALFGVDLLYLLIAMRTVYAQSWAKTVVKWLILCWASTGLLLLGVVAAALLAFLLV